MFYSDTATDGSVSAFVVIGRRKGADCTQTVDSTALTAIVWSGAVAEPGYGDCSDVRARSIQVERRHATLSSTTVMIR